MMMMMIINDTEPRKLLQETTFLFKTEKCSEYKQLQFQYNKSLYKLVYICPSEKASFCCG